MRTAILADIHANREAFEACLSHAREAGADRFVLLGDYVGYGADPGWVTDRVAEMVGAGAVAVKGNHDAAIAEGSGGMNALASAAIAWTVGQLTPAQAVFLNDLALTAHEGDRLYVHANAWAPADWDYVTSDRTAERSMAYCAARLSFVGHVHAAALYVQVGAAMARRHEPKAGVAMPLARSCRWLAVVGSVGQPRDGVPAANYCLYDDARGELTYQRVGYDCEAAARKIEAAGLPSALAQRLRLGR